MSLKTRLLLAFLVTLIVTISVLSMSSVYLTSTSSKEALTEAAQKRLISQNVQTKEAITEYFGFIESQVRSKSFDETTVKAAQAFTEAFNHYAEQRGNLSANELRGLNQYYSEDFSNKYNQLNPKPIIAANKVIATLSNNTQSLQYDFIAGSSFNLGEKDGLVALNKSSSYADAHKHFHPGFRHFLQEFGYYDVFIADMSGNIVYSVFKELDFATSLTSGPYANTQIGKVFNKALNANQDEVVHSRFEYYLPSYNAMAGFLASPIYANGRAIAVLIFQVPMDRINSILIHGAKWQEKGFGDSGETYLVNKDNVLLSESRFFMEDPQGYFQAIVSKYPEQAKEIQAKGTSVGIQPVESETARLGLSGQSGFKVVKDYRGVEVFSAYSRVKFGDADEALLAEIDVSEALKPANELSATLVSSILMISLALLLIAVFGALWFSAKLVRPLTHLGEVCDGLAGGTGDLTVKLKTVNIPELDRVVTGFNQFIGQIRDIVIQIKSDADSLASASEELSNITQQSAAKTAEQRDQSYMVATAMQQLALAVEEVSKSTIHTNNQSLQAQKSLNENMERADLAAGNIKLLVNLIDESSQVIGSLKHEVNQITAFLNVITSIADQTNLLALNAAIEAARAGDAGRGFSVVADEVRALANRSQESTVEISKLVEVMNMSATKSVNSMERATAAADGGIHLVDLVTVALEELSTNLKQVIELSEVVAAATEEQNQTSNSVLVNMKSISELANEVELGSKHTNQAAESLAKTAAHTHSILARFKV